MEYRISRYIFLAAAVTLTAGQSLRISPPSADKTVTRSVRENIVLTCVVDGVGDNATPRLQWFDDDRREIDELTGRIYIEKQDSQTLKLYINRIEEADAGTYSCAGWVDGNQVEEEVQLMIYYDIEFQHYPTPQHPAIGTDALIECTVTGQPVPTVSWRYMGNTIPSEGRYSYETDGLRIRGITEDDNGLYQCRAEVESAGNLKSKDIEVIVYIPPTITHQLGTVEGTEGQYSEIRCEASGKPEAKYEFYRHRTVLTTTTPAPLSTSSASTARVTSDAPTLSPVDLLSNITLPDQAINQSTLAEVNETLALVRVKRLTQEILSRTKRISTDISDITAPSHTLSTIVKQVFSRIEREISPSDITEPIPQNITNMDLEELHKLISENTAGVDTPIQLLTPGASTDTVPVQSSPDGRITVDRDQGILHFRTLDKTDESQYTCKAINPAGDDTSTGNLKVLVPPRILELHNITTTENDMAVLKCKVEADPPAQMTFRKYGYEIYSDGDNEGGRIQVRLERDNELHLMIASATPEDTHNYTCHAQNSVGQVFRNGTVGVQFRPRFSDDPVIQPTEFFNWAGARRNMTCFAQGEPEPMVKWYRYGQELRSNETYQVSLEGRHSVMRVFVQEGDSTWVYGGYTCRAQNSLGAAEKEIYLRRATVPDQPESVSVRDQTPTMVSLVVQAPDNDGGVPINGYRIEYDGLTQDFTIREAIRLINLKPTTLYVFQIRAKNDVGVGPPREHPITTESIRAPYPIVITSDPDGAYPYSYVLHWETPRTGGLAIKYYEFSYRRVEVYEGTFDSKEPLDDYTKIRVQDDADRPMLTYTLENLKPNTFYNVEIVAHNELGNSVPNPDYVFKTAADLTKPFMPIINKEWSEDSEIVTTELTTEALINITEKENEKGYKLAESRANPAASHLMGLSTGSIIGIVIAVFFIFLLIVDVSCYFMNDCGVLMCISIHLCGKAQPGAKERAMEEGERERLDGDEDEDLKEPLPHNGGGGDAPMIEEDADEKTPLTDDSVVVVGDLSTDQLLDLSRETTV